MQVDIRFTAKSWRFGLGFDLPDEFTMDGARGRTLFNFSLYLGPLTIETVRLNCLVSFTCGVCTFEHTGEPKMVCPPPSGVMICEDCVGNGHTEHVHVHAEE